MHTAFTALVAFSLDDLVDLLGCVALLARQSLALVEQLVYAFMLRSQHRGRSRLVQLIGFGYRLNDRFADRLPIHSQPPVYGSGAPPLDKKRSVGLFGVFPSLVLLTSST